MYHKQPCNFSLELKIEDTSFRVRPATIEDTEKIKAILQSSSVHAHGSHHAAARGNRRSILRRALSFVLRPLYSSRVNWRHFIVLETDEGNIIGCGKILPHKGNNWEVASLSIEKRWRGKGGALIGGKYILEHAPRPLWGLCQPRYLPFYNRFGAVEVTDSELIPAFLKKRLRTFDIIMKLNKRRENLIAIVIK
jgi:GNAT superfamily N-acetyltransferase